MSKEARNNEEQNNHSSAEEFADRLVGMLNSAALALMTSIGHRTGLFDQMAEMEPATSSDIASRAGLDERYVREWLGAMTVGDIVRHDPDAGTYHLPRERAAFLSRAFPADNIAVFAQYIAILGAVEDDVVHCFKHGGGVPYDRYPRFHEVMAEDSGQSVVAALDDHIVPLVPGLRERLESGARVLDAGCGRGRAINHLAQRFPKSQFEGYDLSEAAIEVARDEARACGNANVHFEVRDLSDFDRTAEPAAYDVVTTFDAIHDQANPKALLRGIRRTLADDGVYLAQDIKGSGHHHGDREHPIGPLLYTISCLHCMTVSLANNGEGLGAMWGRTKALEYFESAGFSDVEVHELEHDFQNNWYICRP